MFVFPSPSPSPPAVPEIAHVVTSDRGSESAARAARTTYVVTAADIARDGDRTVADAVQNVPGVELLRYGAFGADSTVGIRGSSAQQVLVLLDGLPIAGAQINNVNLEQMPVGSVQRVEIVEGGGSTLYGSGSIGGVINIITSGHTQSSATVSTGSFDAATYLLQTPYLSFQRSYAGNAYALPDGSTRLNAQAGLTSGSLRYSHAIGALDFDFFGGVTDAVLGAPGGVPYTSSTSEQGTIARDLRARVERRTQHSTLSVAIGDSDQDETFTCNSPAEPNSCPNAYPTPYPSGTPPPYAQYVSDWREDLSASDAVGNDRVRVVYGLDLSAGNARIAGGTGSACTDPYRCGKNYPGQLHQDSVTLDAYSQSALYVQSQWFGGNGGEFYAGLRGERDGNALASAQGAAVTPSIGGILPLGMGWQLKLNAAGAFRAPTSEELFYPPQGVYSNDALVPEKTSVGDATFVSTTRFGTLSAGWFATYGSNLIVDQNPALFEYKPENVGKASIQGITVAWSSPARPGLSETASITNLYRAQDLNDNIRIVGRGPVIASTFGLRYTELPGSRWDGWGVTLTSDGPSEYPPPPSYGVPWWAQANAFTTLDGYVGYRIASKLAVTLRGYNLLNDRYAVFNGYPMPGPSFALELHAR
ncbi:MAG: TonB-dependent receptor [Candidatus Eremiobacteraeota bacterium]|nr:TonB-dependent receptor [Candidatus Eremiobacteraeota bacterium]